MLPTNYLNLIQYYEPRPIKDEEDQEAVQTVIDVLLDCENLTQDQQDYLYLLGLTVQDYESKMEPLPTIHGVELLKQLMINYQVKQKDLVPIFKTESIVSEVLKGKRKLTVRHIAELAKFFNVSPAAFFSVE
jgi:HTH-type transcriptional regulator/antitoxin HigA